MEEQRIAKSHKLVVNNRKTSMVTGVLDVLSFDLNEILLETEQGMLMVKGTGSSCEPAQRGKGRGGSVGEYRQYRLFERRADRETGGKFPVETV